MTECKRMSTWSRSATSAALRSGLTLNPTTMAFDAEASSTSDSLMAPTPERMMLILTFSSESFVSVSASTSAEPWTSAFTMIGNSLTPPSEICSFKDSRVRRPPLAPSACSLARVWRNVAICRAFAASATVWNGSPGCGRLVSPSTSTGVAGPGCFTGRPRSFVSARPGPPAVVEYRAHAADNGTGNEVVTHAERAVLYEDGGDGTAAAIQLGLEHGT